LILFFVYNELVSFQALEKAGQSVVEGFYLVSEFIFHAFCQFFHCPASIAEFPEEASYIIEFYLIGWVFESGKEVFRQEWVFEFRLEKDYQSSFIFFPAYVLDWNEIKKID
jgi:hypothetical protein